MRQHALITTVAGICLLGLVACGDRTENKMPEPITPSDTMTTAPAEVPPPPGRYR